jgi:hypothetical protein
MYSLLSLLNTGAIEGVSEDTADNWADGVVLASRERPQACGE